jgi:ATP-dependent Clp protease protease subunit
MKNHISENQNEAIFRNNRYRSLLLLASLRATPTPDRFSSGAQNLQPWREDKSIQRTTERTGFFNGPKDPRKWFSVVNEDSSESAEITIYDRIGKSMWSGDGTDAKDFVAELNKIPKEKEIKLRINSPGGSVDEGMTIYNRLAERRDKITCVIDGLAASIASVIALAGKSLEMPKNAAFMIHDPWGYAEGTAAEMRKAAETLDKYKDRIVSVYRTKTKASEDEIKQWMSDTTWYDGEEARTAGFCDTVTDEEVSFQACARFDLSDFKRVPEQLKNTQNTKDKSNMNRTQIIARLDELGIEFEADASDEQLQALLTEADAANRTKKTAKKAAKNGTKTKKTERNAEIGNEDDGGDGNDGDEEEPSAPANRSRNRIQDRQTDPAYENRLKAIEAKYEAERKSRIEREVQDCVNEDRIPATQSQEWVEDILNAPTEERGQKILARLKGMTPRLPGATPLGIDFVSDSPRDVEKGLLKFREPINSFMRGNHISPEVVGENARATATLIGDKKNREKLQVILNTNTIDPNLKRTVILSDLMRAFRRKLIVVTVFTTKFDNVQVQLGQQGGLNTVTVPFYDLDTTSSTDWNAANGYLFAENTTVGTRQININKRKYKTVDLSSDTFRRQPYFSLDTSVTLKSEQLAVDVWTDVLSIIKASNYPTEAMHREPTAFDSDDMAVLQKAADDNDWPDLGRAFVGGTAHRQALNQDDAIKHWMNSNSTDALREGSPGRLSGFDTFFSPRIPTNSEDLAAFICMPQAALFASAPIMPAPGVRQQLLAYDVIVDPQTGIAFEYRYGADVWKDKDREVIECNYGYGLGNGSALQRITAGAANYSSTSSASSVNSSSSSSSSPSF